MSSLIILFFVDIPKGRQDAERWAKEQRNTGYTMYSDRSQDLEVSEKGRAE